MTTIQVTTREKAAGTASPDVAIAVACNVVASANSDLIRSAHVVAGRRLTASELIRAQKVAAKMGVRLSMNGQGVVTIRRAQYAPILSVTGRECHIERCHARVAQI